MQEGLSRAVIGVFAAALVAVLGLIASGVGWITCHEEVQSSQQAPHLCRSAGNGAALWLPPVVGAVAVLLLLVSGVRTKTLGIATASVIAAEGALLLMWALVSHGTIHY